MISLIGFASFSACSHSTTAAPDRKPAGAPAVVPPEKFCVTKGTLGARIDSGLPVDVPTMRLVATGTIGESASLKFWFRGDTSDKTALANGAERRQLGLKLRAANGCNLVYVMWRLDPKPKLEVSVKSNPGMRTHEDCGANGYIKVKPDAKPLQVPPLRIGATHTLRAEIKGDALTAWIDDAVAWSGTLPEEARALEGPAGVRSDNLAFDLVELLAPAGPDGQCKHQEGD